MKGGRERGREGGGDEYKFYEGGKEEGKEGGKYGGDEDNHDFWE